MNQPKIHPVVIYPFSQPKSLDGLSKLYDSLKALDSDPRFERPVTIVNNQTHYRSDPIRAADPAVAKAYEDAIGTIVSPTSDVTRAWSVDTCAMWLRGLGDSFQSAKDKNAHHDIFWLIPGDFNYATPEGATALNRLIEIPLKVYDHHCNICIGEIEVPLNSAKQLIDTYGTYGLLYNWFPAEAQGIRKLTSKPRSEFFALTYDILERALIESRWFAYEQTLMILLQNMHGQATITRIVPVELGRISDDESTRSTLSAAMQQVERTERALKLFWREQAEREMRMDWHDEFRQLDAQSESVRTAAMVILRRLLK
jgi:hypothetical protein